MSSFYDFYSEAIVDLWADIVICLRNLGQPSQDIDLSDEPGGLLNPLIVKPYFFPNLLKDLPFHLHPLLFSPQHLFFHNFQGFCNVPFSIGQGLFPYVVRRNQVKIGLRDLNIVPEDLVKPHLQA